MKNLNRIVHSSKEAHETCNYPEYVLRLQKTSNMTKIKNSFTFFVKNPCGSQQSHNDLQILLKL